MIRVLFVDDEQSLLDGLRNILRKQRHEWDVVFALGGAAGLLELAKAPADVVVSDMRMPGMDGATFLQRGRDAYPGTVRIVLSGDADREAVMKTLPVAHQHISKPCAAERLISVVNRTRNLHQHLDNASLRSVIAGLDHLPSEPRVYLDIMSAAGQPSTTLDDVTEIVERDPALVAKVLQLTNSAYFGLSRELGSIREAVQHLGLDVLKGLALSGHVFGTSQASAQDSFLGRLQHHSLHTARLARTLAASQRGAEEAFTAAIVHDIGEIVMASARGAEYVEGRRLAKVEGRLVHEVEEEMFGTTHAGVGAYLLGMWGLPLAVIETTAYHHRPRVASAETRQVLGPVYVADVLADWAEQTSAGLAVAPQFDDQFLEACGIIPDLPRWTDLARALTQPAASAA
ncbi:MAG: response regulator [Vicinamibacterales bacterium]